jgi:hypothetical protein
LGVDIEAGVESVRRDSGLRPVDRAVAGFLLALMILGSLVLWIGVPAGVLYLLSRVTTSTTSHYLGGLLAVPAAMAAFGALLLWINSLYMRVSRTALVSEEKDGLRRVHGPLGMILSTSLLVAVVALVAWLAVYGGQTPQGGGVW